MQRLQLFPTKMVDAGSSSSCVPRSIDLPFTGICPPSELTCPPCPDTAPYKCPAAAARQMCGIASQAWCCMDRAIRRRASSRIGATFYLDSPTRAGRFRRPTTTRPSHFFRRGPLQHVQSAHLALRLLLVLRHARRRRLDRLVRDRRARPIRRRRLYARLAVGLLAARRGRGHDARQHGRKFGAAAAAASATCSCAIAAATAASRIRRLHIPYAWRILARVDARAGAMRSRLQRDSVMALAACGRITVRV